MSQIRALRLVPRPSWVVLLLAGVVGCGSKEEWMPVVKDPAYPVTGKVLLPGGKPLPGGRIEFIPIKEPGLTAVSEIRPDGSFALKSREPGDGAVPGDYKIRILIPEKKEYRRFANYRDEDGSKITATIKAESNNLAPFTLTPVKLR
jgi:hypothetical protein